MNEIVSQGLGILAKVAPTLATMIGGPFAGQAVAGIAGIFGLGVTDKDSALAAIATATPEQLLALKAEDNRHSEALAKLGLDREALDATDRDSARKREATVKDWMPRVLGLLVVTSFVVVTILVLSDNAPAVKDEKALLTVGAIIGILGNETKAVLAYYFGSSSGSQAKDATISKLSV